MSKPTQVFLVAGALLLSTVSPVMAMNVIIQSDGRVDFYQAQVLGDEIETPEVESEVESKEAENSQKVEEQQREAAKQNQERNRETGKKEQELKQRAAEQVREKAKLIKTFPKSPETKLRLKTDGKKTELKVETLDSTRFKSEVVTGESEPGQVKLTMPARPNPATRQLDDDPSFASPSAERIETERKRDLRESEELEIETQTQSDGQDELELTSRRVKAVAPGAEIVIDPTSRVVKVVTPNGEEKVLTHLPDQAVSRMQAAGLVSDKTAIVAGDVTLETNDEGRLEYILPQKKTRKLFGIFTREVTTQVHVDDESGETFETTVPASSLVGRIMDALAK